MGLKLDHYLEDRAKYHEVDSKLHQAEGALDVLKYLKEKHHVLILDFAFAELIEKIEAYKKEAELIAVEDFDSSKLLLELPEEIGAIDVEKMDFKSALQFAANAGVEKRERGETSTKAKEDADFVDEEIWRAMDDVLCF